MVFSLGHNGYKLYNGEWCTLLQQATAYKIIVYLVIVLINLGANY
jgi:hypothetical protein